MPIFAGQCFENPVEKVICFCAEDVPAAVARVEELARVYHVVGSMRYELKDALLGLDCCSDVPLLYFEAFESCTPFVPKSVKDDALIDLRSLWGQARYAEAFEQVKAELKVGNSYEVNLTQPFELLSSLGDEALFHVLYQRQPTPYAAFLQNEFESILSFSPELFFSLRDGVIHTKPMKGTIRRAACPVEDAELRDFLSSYKKNRSVS